MTTPSTLAEWLAHCERLHPKTIDLSLERVQRVRARLSVDFACPVFTVAGTNGKGSTCAMLEAILRASGYRVGVYTSPHLVHFEERCRVDGEMIEAAQLLPHFAAVEAARADETLTYFEFTTLVILRLLAGAELDAVVLEVGLGGRLDAVNLIDTDCAILTSIDLDHMDYLGPDRESIGREKAGILRPGRPAIVADPLPPRSVLDQAREIGADLWRAGIDFNFQGDPQQWGWAGRARRHHGLAYPALRGANQLLNASGVLAALEAMRPRLPVTAQAVRNGLAMVELPGRFQIVPGEPTLVLDVAHNPHAVSTLTANLDQMGYHPRTHAVFGAMKDKDIESMFARMLVLVDRWYFSALPTPRAASVEELVALHARALAARPAGLAPLPPHEPHGTYSAPRTALLAALDAADPADRIVVFGSFFTVGGVLADGLPRRAARHLA
ncbi:bifunctional tetrahydrofolate synthase/dihydrofolate synthase [Methylibium sp.]|uniref:bifunctional tetrahydrofolate synthase/dihydrofolate synthase n=1 Tax=Methylibium sp. TaxID=2067992 RepID=UPI00286C8BE5|nr:bifunctional tetrahydrofolate synthase/dihydrofolate synthase [Methylibium sp.]